ncbi:MAG: aspartate aminotransferase family protein [Saprospiraceae bacterium]|nr:aspartate aminotransferase family protein [Saprospiraceae bacterium]
MTTIRINTPIPGPKSQAILARRAAALPAGAAKSTEVVVHAARGAVVEDIDGNTLLDFAGGIGMINVGHSPETVVEAMKEQLDRFIHACQIVATFEAPIELCERLNALTPGDFPKKTLLCNSGSEAVENAVNIAKYATGRPGVIVFEGAYHGRTLLTMSLTSKYGLFKKGYGSMVSDIYRLLAPNLYRTPEGMTEEDYLDYCISKLDAALISQIDPSAVAAILIEPVLGEGGFIPIPARFLKKLRDVADKHGIVLIFDEIQCGMMRTGKMFACEHAGVAPDIMVMAKSLGAGMPIAAVTGKADIMDAPHLGGVGGTYGGSPVACVAAIEALKILTSDAFKAQSDRMQAIMDNTLADWKERYALIGDARGLGTMQVVEFVKDKKTKTPDPDLTLEIIKDAVAGGLLLIRAGLYSNCIRLLPPVVMTEDQLKEGLAVLEGAIQRAHQKRM